MRTLSPRVAPDPERAKRFADKITGARNPVLIYGPGLEKAGGWDVGVRFAEKLQFPVFASPFTEAIPFPVIHEQFQGSLPPAIGPLCERLRGFDLALVVGAQVFRYYPYVAGSYLPEGTELLQITADPNEAATAFVGDSMLGDPKLALEALIDLVPEHPKREWPSSPRPPLKVSNEGDVLYADELFSTLAESRPNDAILVAESTSNVTELLNLWWIAAPGSYYSFASGGLGWGAPAAVGVALAVKSQGDKRPVVAVIGDGAFQYSVQCLYTAAQHQLPIVFVVVRNGEYGVLKDFAVLEEAPNAPGLDLPGLDISSIAKGFGCQATVANSQAEVKGAFLAALGADSPTVITVPVRPEIRPLA